ncbi:hypothetical protein BJ684DRAFT_21024 [Piptocephalis cylindrospora]|uniref:Uncharacterized protein n=1 Tax=Piptocephalis cylindrospora TaxID=1907219 RepID=A0A4P9Y107_9FUNG|nr:hypothetical protein BJ684DRAFT_21024 [Piptocephalis cylindrospora]|eukprot:RKP12438.1 hypothetical protein BJ684DRAFT_21024 [Piptocephalis cylindrospora]
MNSPKRENSFSQAKAIPLPPSQTTTRSNNISSPTPSDNAPLANLLSTRQASSNGRMSQGNNVDKDPLGITKSSDHLSFTPIKDTDHYLVEDENKDKDQALPLLKDTSDHLLQDANPLQQPSSPTSDSSMTNHASSTLRGTTNPSSSASPARQVNPPTAPLTPAHHENHQDVPSKASTTAKLVQGKVAMGLGKVLNKDSLVHKGENKLVQAYTERDERARGE